MSKKHSRKNTYGWVRAEVLGALVNSVFLVALCFTIFVEAIQRLTHTNTIEKVDSMIFVGVAGLVVNIIGLILFCGYGQSGEDRGEQEQDQQSQGRPTVVSWEFFERATAYMNFALSLLRIFWEATMLKRMKIDTHCQRRNCSALNVVFNDVGQYYIDIAERS